MTTCRLYVFSLLCRLWSSVQDVPFLDLLRLWKNVGNIIVPTCCGLGMHGLPCLMLRYQRGEVTGASWQGPRCEWRWRRDYLQCGYQLSKEDQGRGWFNKLARKFTVSAILQLSQTPISVSHLPCSAVTREPSVTWHEVTAVRARLKEYIRLHIRKG